MFKPCNRYVLIIRDTKKEESLIALPEGTFRSEDKYEKVEILATAPEVRPPISVGHSAVVLAHMIEEVEFDDTTAYLILENHILAILGEDYETNR